LQGCLQVVMEVVELGISGSKSREIPRVSNTRNQCGFTCTLNVCGKTPRRGVTALASLHLTDNCWVINDTKISRSQLSSVTQQSYKLHHQLKVSVVAI